MEQNTNTKFQLFLFSINGETVLNAVSGGISGIVIDWENAGKTERQAGSDTQINNGTVEDLRRIRSLTRALVICRVNRNNFEEIDMAANNGADEILLPMIRTVEEVEAAIDYAKTRCKIGILIETNEAVQLSRELGRLPLSRVYVGLNDLAIDRKVSNIFLPLVDGTIDHVRQSIKAPFAFAGLTLPEAGFPIPCRLLISEMARNNCSFALLRRSFLSDTRGKDMSKEIPRIYQAVSNAFRDSKQERERKLEEIKKAILDL